MMDKRRVKEIVKKIKKTKKMVAGKFDKKIEKNQHLFSILAPVFAGLLFFVFSLLNLKGSVGFEEAYAKYATQGNFGDIFNVTTVDARSPLFYFILKMWSSIFGMSDVALRFMSIFFGLVAIVFVFHLVKRCFGVKTASFATVLVSISPMFIRFGQEIGVYSLLFLALIVSTYTLSLAVEQGMNKKGNKYWVFYILFMTFSLWLNYLAAVVFIPQIIYTVLHFGGIKKIFKNKKVLKKLIIVFMSIIVLFVPWIIIMALRAGTVSRGWEPVSFEKLFDFILSSLLYNGGAKITGWGVVIGILFIIAMIVAITEVCKKVKAKNKEKIEFVLFMVCAPIVLLLIFSLPPFRGNFETKNLIFSTVALWVLFGIVLSLMKDTPFRNILTALIFVVAGMGVINVESREPEGYISEILAETFIAANEDEPIVIKNAKTFYEGRFYSSEKHQIYLFEDEMNMENSTAEAIKYYKAGLIEDKDAFLNEYESVWYVIETPPAGIKYEVPKWAEKHRITSEISFDHYTALEFTK